MKSIIESKASVGKLEREMNQIDSLLKFEEFYKMSLSEIRRRIQAENHLLGILEGFSHAYNLEKSKRKEYLIVMLV